MSQLNTVMNIAFLKPEREGESPMAVATGVTEDDSVLSQALASLGRNNTFCPNVAKVAVTVEKTAARNDDGSKKRDEAGKVVTRDQKRMTVWFADGTFVKVDLREGDADDPVTALSFAIVKRLFGSLTPSGYVNGGGFLGKLKGFVDAAETPEKLEKARSEAAEARKRAEAEVKKEADEHPSLGKRLRSLEEKFATVLDVLAAMNGAKDKLTDDGEARVSEPPPDEPPPPGAK